MGIKNKTYLLLYFIKENNYLRGVAWLSDVEKPSNEGGGQRAKKQGDGRRLIASKSSRNRPKGRKHNKNSAKFRIFYDTFSKNVSIFAPV